MEMRRLGLSELRLSLLGLGCNSIGVIPDDESRALIQGALELGINHFDTAPVYAAGRSEELLGRELADHRNQVVIATKIGHPSSDPNGSPCSAQRVREQAESSLQRLRTDRIDVLYVHFPDPKTPIEETLRALEQLVQQGKVRAIGLSNFSHPELTEALLASNIQGPAAVACCQFEYNLLSRAAESTVLPTARRGGLGFIPSFPLASGLLAGKYRPEQPPDETSVRARVVRRFQDRFLKTADWGAIDRLRDLALHLQAEMSCLALAWLMHKPVVTSIIAGATSVSQLARNANALRMKLAPRELLELENTVATVREMQPVHVPQSAA